MYMHWMNVYNVHTLNKCLQCTYIEWMSAMYNTYIKWMCTMYNLHALNECLQCTCIVWMYTMYIHWMNVYYVHS